MKMLQHACNMPWGILSSFQYNLEKGCNRRSTILIDVSSSDEEQRVEDVQTRVVHEKCGGCDDR